MAFTSRQKEGRNCRVERKMELTKTLKRIRTIRTTPNQPLKKKMKKIGSKESIRKKRKRKLKMVRLDRICLNEKRKEMKIENELKRGKKELRPIPTGLATLLRNHLLSFVELS